MLMIMMNIDVYDDWQVLIPAEETTYWCAVRLLPAMREKHHIIQASLRADAVALICVNQ